MPARLALALAACLACGRASASAAAPASTPPPASELNAAYSDPAELRAWTRRFEHEGREVRDRKPEILADMSLRPGMKVVDLGAGTGLYSLDLARAVGPAGRVFAVDIVPHFLRLIERRAAKAGLTNLTTLPGLPDEPVDLVFLCDAYHHLERPAEVLAAIRRVLRPGGALVVVDLDRVPGKSPAWIFGHVRADKSQVLAELAAAGFSLTADRTDALGLRDNYLLYLRPDDRPSP